MRYCNRLKQQQKPIAFSIRLWIGIPCEASEILKRFSQLKVYLTSSKIHVQFFIRLCFPRQHIQTLLLSSNMFSSYEVPLYSLLHSILNGKTAYFHPIPYYSCEIKGVRFMEFI